MRYAASFGTGDGLLPVPGQSPAPSEPDESALNDPMTWENFETLGGIDETRALIEKGVSGAQFDIPKR